MPSFYLGIDGGQSSTTALIADDSGRIIGSGYGGPCNHVRGPDGRTKFAKAIGGCLQGACREAGLKPETLVFASACLGFSGGPEDKEAETRALIRSSRYKITHDAEIALAGATAGEPGIIVIAGTGSMAFGRNAQGKTARAGGWGYIFGDEGGAFDITRRALRAALRFEEGWGEPTALREVLLKATGARDANDLLHSFYADVPRPAVASLAPLVSSVAELGDQPARRILSEAAAKLAWFVEGVYSQLFQKGATVPVARIGGVFKSELLRRNFSDSVQASIGCRVDAASNEPGGRSRFGSAALGREPSCAIGRARIREVISAIGSKLGSSAVQSIHAVQLVLERQMIQPPQLIS